VVIAPVISRARTPNTGLALKTTFLSLGNNSNAILVEPAKLDPAKARIAILIAHPEGANTFNYFIGRELPRYGYRVMMMNTYGPERTYEQFMAPLASAITALRAVPGVEKVILAGHSTGGPELTAYEDVAENGAKACREVVRISKCTRDKLDHLPRADGLMLLDSNAGAPERTISLDPALDPRRPGNRNATLDMFAARNGFDPATKGAKYSVRFRRAYFAAQAARANRLTDRALERLDKLEKGEGAYKDDEPFIVPGSDLHVNGARLDLADTSILSKTSAPHMLLKADGSRPVQILDRLPIPSAKPEDVRTLYRTTLDVTVRHYLSFDALRLTSHYALGESKIAGIVWRSTSNSVPGNVEGIHVPTLVMGATCAPHLVFSEIAFDRSAAADKTFVGLEGANHTLRACRPEYGDTMKRAFDFVDEWLSKPGRF
jgi:pimeloyl-ACP methyl ester carboxylesterase